MRDQQEIPLCKSIIAIYTQHRMVYGSRKVHCKLREHGVRVGRNRVARIMQEQGLSGIRKPKKFNNASHSTPSALLKKELNRQFNPTKPDVVWLTDFRRCVSKVAPTCFSRSYSTCLPPKPGVLLHSDHGSEYTSLEMQLYMQKYGKKRSFSRMGNCWNNAPIERFFRHCKAELRSVPISRSV